MAEPGKKFDVLSLLFIIGSIVLGTGLFVLAGFIDARSMAMVTQTYTSLGLGTVLAFMAASWIWGMREPYIPTLREFVIGAVATFWLPLAMAGLSALGPASIAGVMPQLGVPVLEFQADVPEEPLYNTMIGSVARSLGVPLSHAASLMYNIFIGPMETLLFHCYLPLIVIAALEKYVGAGLETDLTASILSNLWFGMLHVIYQGPPGFLYAFLVGNLATVTNIWLWRHGVNGFAGSAFAHTAYNIIVLASKLGYV